MPVAFVVVAKEVKEAVNLAQLQEIARSIVAQGLDSKSRLLDETHISITIIEGNYHNSVSRRTKEIDGINIRGYVTPRYDPETSLWQLILEILRLIWRFVCSTKQK